MTRHDGVVYKFFDQAVAGWWAFPPPAMVTALRAGSAEFDVIHSHALHKPLAVLLARFARLDAPLVVTPHYHGTGHTVPASVAHVAYRPVARHALRDVAHLVAVSDPEAALLARHFPRLADRITTIPNGIRPVPPAAPYPQDGPVVLGVGRLEPYKGFDRVIRALAHLEPAIRLVVVGAGPDQARLERLAEESGMRDRVSLMSSVPQADLDRWWATADAFVSLSAHEAFGLTLGEALSAGVPTLASDIPAHRYVASLADAAQPSGQGISFLPPGASDQDLAAGLRRLVAGGRNASTVISTWEGAAEATLAVYARVLGDSVGRRPR